MIKNEEEFTEYCVVCRYQEQGISTERWETLLERHKRLLRRFITINMMIHLDRSISFYRLFKIVFGLVMTIKMFRKVLQ